MKVCVCYNISDRELDKYSSIEEMRRHFPNLGTKCGECIRYLRHECEYELKCKEKTNGPTFVQTD